jgi:dephospho-CoA kinase
MVVIGLVGRIGAGKSTVARRFAEHGATVIDADRIAHAALDDADVKASVLRTLGASVADAEGRVDRAAVARRVFGDTAAHAAALAALEAIVHPWVRRRMESQLVALGNRSADAGEAAVAVLDVPLLVQAGWSDLCTHLVVVSCEDSVRRERLAGRGWSADQIASRDRAWERAYRPPPPGPNTWCVDASGDPTYTATQVDRIWQAMRGF